MNDEHTPLLEDEDDNWLNREKITCPGCQRGLERIDHSPFYDYYFLYCDSCPIHVEVSYYDKEFERIQQDLGEHTYTELMHAIEVRLKPCVCGGTFRDDAPRRCFTCHAPVIVTDPSGIDLWPPEEEVDEEQEVQWWKSFTRADNLWREEA